MVGVVEGLENMKESPKIVMKDIEKALESIIPTSVTLLDARQPSTIFRQLSSSSVREISWRSCRPYLVAESTEIDETNSDDSVIRVRGYLRGSPLQLHSLGHLVGAGTCRVTRVEVIPRVKGGEAIVFESSASQQDSVELFASADVLMGEQTWPTEAELETADSAVRVDGHHSRHAPPNV
jgi:pre-rRNA-processing protein TSR1